MNLLLKLKPWDAHLDAFEKTKSMTDKDAVKACITIWDEWKNIPEVSQVIWGKIKATPKTDMACGSCVGDAISSLVAWRNSQRSTVPKISFKGVPDMSKPKAKVSEEVVEPKLKFSDGLPEIKAGEDCGMTQERLTGFDLKSEVTPATEEEMIAFYKTHLNAKGVSYHHKARVKKLRELYEANR